MNNNSKYFWCYFIAPSDNNLYITIHCCLKLEHNFTFTVSCSHYEYQTSAFAFFSSLAFLSLHLPFMCLPRLKQFPKYNRQALHWTSRLDSMCIFIVELFGSVVWQMGQNIDGTGIGPRVRGAVVRIFLSPEDFRKLILGWD